MCKKRINVRTISRVGRRNCERFILSLLNYPQLYFDEISMSIYLYQIIEASTKKSRLDRRVTRQCTQHKKQMFIYLAMI